MSAVQGYLSELDWHRVDASTDPAAYAAYLERLDASAPMQIFRRSFLELLPCRPGDRVLDSGCGAGSDTVLLAQKLGPKGRVLGIDFSQSLLRRARARRAGPVAYAAGSLLRLPLAENSFDGAICNRVLMHLRDPQEAVRQLVRALKSGAWLALCEPDWSAARLEPDGPISRALMRAHSAGYVNGSIGAQLPELMRNAGCKAFQVHEKNYAARAFGQVMATANFERSLRHLRQSGQCAASEIQQWYQDMEAADERGIFSCRLKVVVCLGRKETS